LLGRRGIGWVALQQDLGADTVQLRFVPSLLGAPRFGEHIVQAPERGIYLAGTRFGFGEGRFETGQEPTSTLLPTRLNSVAHLGKSRLFGAVGPLCPALKKCRAAGPKAREIVSRHDIGTRLTVGRDRFGVAPNKPQPRREHERMSHRRSMRCRFGIGEGLVGKPQSFVDSTEHPQCESVENLRCGARIRAEPVGETAMARLVVDFDALLEMVMGAGKIAEIPAGGAGDAVRDHGLGVIGPGCGFA
jgi:hypothetical protein